MATTAEWDLSVEVLNDTGRNVFLFFLLLLSCLYVAVVVGYSVRQRIMAHATELRLEKEALRRRREKEKMLQQQRGSSDGGSTTLRLGENDHEGSGGESKESASRLEEKDGPKKNGKVGSVESGGESESGEKNEEIANPDSMQRRVLRRESSCTWCVFWWLEPVVWYLGLSSLPLFLLFFFLLLLFFSHLFFS